MKMIKLLGALAVGALCLSSCAKLVPNEISEENSNIMNLTVKGLLESDLTTEYSSVVDTVSYTVTVQVPYYLSDTEPVQGDLTKMRLIASLPRGAKFSPSLAGTHDLLEGFKSTLTYVSGESHEYSFYATYKKSEEALLSQIRPTNSRVAVSIIVSQPTEAGGHGLITAIKNVVSAEAMKKCTVVRSAWSTIEGESVTYDSAEGVYYYDLESGKSVTVVSQDGKHKTTYDVSFEIPDVVDHGVGHVEHYWSFQVTAAAPHGFEKDANRNLAIADGYLIVSNSKDPSKMLVINKSTGELEDIKVNATGMPKDREFRAIASDDVGHLVAATYTSTKENSDAGFANGYDCYVTDPAVRIFVWADGIDKAPTEIFNQSITTFQAIFASTCNIGNRIGVTGDLTSGKANVLFHDTFAGRVYPVYFEDGVYQKHWVQCPNTDGKAAWIAQWINSKANPMAPSDTWVSYYFSSASAQRKHFAVYEKRYVEMPIPAVNTWYVDNNDFVLSHDEATINGATIMAFSNYRYMTSGILAGRLYVAEIGDAPTATSLTDGFMFETRENNNSPYGTIPGTGYALSGMTSTYPYAGGASFGTDDIRVRCGDVVIDKHSDPYEMGVYMLSMNAGIIAYKMSAYDL